MKLRQTGFDQWLQKKLDEDPEFKKEYEKSLKEIREHDRLAQEEALAKNRKPS